MRRLHGEHRAIQISAHVTLRFLPFVLFSMMGAAFLLVDAILPLGGIWSYDALLSHISALFLLPTHLLFPTQAIKLIVANVHATKPILTASWKETALLFNAFLLLLLVYLAALRYLPAYIHLRFLFMSTLFLGMLSLCIPVVTSQDVFSYIAYARIGVIYHLNPLTTWPVAIRSDPIFTYVYWAKQPSAYGPVWAGITYLFQWFVGLSGSSGPLRMLLVLRFFGLSMHLGSTLLIWSISGHLQRVTVSFSPKQRMRATLAFAWNPLLLFEACVNAHVDATLLFFVLLAIWFLVRRTPLHISSCLLAAATFAVAACVKMNIVLLVPGLLLFVCMQYPRKYSIIFATVATYVMTILMLYIPLWQGKTTLDVILINPEATRNINSLAAFISHLYKGIVHGNAYTLSSAMPTASEKLAHILSIAMFALIYAILCSQTIRHPASINSIPHLIRWMALVWLLYCAIGSPWFYPWYLVTFFGLFALIEASSTQEQWSFSLLRLPLATRILAYSALSVYCFSTWGTLHTFLPFPRGFLWNYLCGLWIWALPLLALRLRTTSVIFIFLRKHYPNFPLNRIKRFNLTPMIWTDEDKQVTTSTVIEEKERFYHEKYHVYNHRCALC